MNKWENVLKRMNSRQYDVDAACIALKTLTDVFMSQSKKGLHEINYSGELIGYAVKTAIKDGKTIIYDVRNNRFVMSKIADFRKPVDSNAPLAESDSIKNVTAAESTWRVANLRGKIPFRPMAATATKTNAASGEFQRLDGTSVEMYSASVKYGSEMFSIIVEKRAYGITWWAEAEEMLKMFDNRLAIGEQNRDILVALSMYVGGILKDETYYQWLIAEYSLEGLLIMYDNSKPVATPLGINSNFAGFASNLYSLPTRTPSLVGYGNIYATDELAKWSKVKKSEKEIKALEAKTLAGRLYSEEVVEGFIEKCFTT